VALDAFFISGHQPAGPEVMAVGAGHVLHFWDHVFRVSMTADAYLLLRFRLVALKGVAGGALDTFLEPVQGVTFGPGDFGNSRVSLQVAGHAHGAGHYNLIVRPL
jgi:hypothetical protein